MKKRGYRAKGGGGGYHQITPDFRPVGVRSTKLEPQDKQAEVQGQRHMWGVLVTWRGRVGY